MKTKIWCLKEVPREKVTVMIMGRDELAFTLSELVLRYLMQLFG